MTKEWFLYILRCRDNSLYTGITTDPERRIAEHASGKGAKYLKGRGPLKLVFKYNAGTHSSALSIEYRLKKLPKVKKEELVKNPVYASSVLESGKR